MNRLSRSVYLSSSLAGFSLCMLVALSLATWAEAKIPIQAVTASSFQDPNVPPNTFDGSLSTRWSAEGSGEWIRFDLGTPQLVNQVFIAWYKGTKRMAEFGIEISQDAIGWAPVFRGMSSGKTGGLQIYAFTEVMARYVRIVGFGNSENAWNSITEVEIHSQRGAGDKLDVVAVRASAHDGNGPLNTIDNTLGSRWSAQGNGQWIEFNLGETKTVTDILIAWYQGDIRTARFDIEISPDAQTWQRVFSGTSNGTSLALETHDIVDVMTQFVRIVGFGNTVNAWNSITEVELRGGGERGAGVDLIGVVPDVFTTNGGGFSLSVIPRDDQGQAIPTRVTKDNFMFRNITVSRETTPEDVLTRGQADVTEIEIIETEAGETVSLLLDFDSSGSMSSNDPDRRRVDAGKQVVALLRPIDQAAIMDFGAARHVNFRASRLLQPFTSDPVLLNQAIDLVVDGGGTPFYDSLLDALDLFRGTPRTNPGIVALTDGEDTFSQNSPAAVIAQAQAQAIPIYTIGLGQSVDFTVLQNIARDTGGTFAEVVDADALVKVFQAIGVGLVDGRVVVTGEGQFTPTLMTIGRYVVSGALVTTLAGQSYNTPFNFPVEVK